MSSLTQLPEHILNKTAVVYLLGDILKEFDPANYEKATSKFRKPSYQRGIKKSGDWNKSLVRSVLEGKAIGGVVMSKWTRAVLDSDNNPTYEEYFNIEDAGTRLGALKKFYDGDFETKYGGIENEDVRKRFTDYRVAVELLEKASGDEIAEGAVITTWATVIRPEEYRTITDPFTGAVTTQKIETGVSHIQTETVECAVIYH